jgi:hypothetical protein
MRGRDIFGMNREKSFVKMDRCLLTRILSPIQIEFDLLSFLGITVRLSIHGIGALETKENHAKLRKKELNKVQCNPTNYLQSN